MSVPTVIVKDAGGANTVVNTLPSAGQQPSSNSLPFVLSTEQEAILGSLTEAAPSTDTNSSGLNGRLQRVAQRLTTILGILPSARGTQLSVNSLSVVSNSDTPLALDGTDGTGISAPSGAIGIRGWLSGIYNTLTNTHTTQIGSLTETVPTSDTASSGLNGRLQRIAQRLTNIIGILPSGLGQASKTGSLAVTLPTEQEAILGSLSETAPTTDTASSGLNGRLQRIAQRLSTILGVLPTARGPQTSVNSISIVSNSDVSLALDGTDASTSVQPTGGAGIRGWLSGIYTKLSGTLTVSGTTTVGPQLNDGNGNSTSVLKAQINASANGATAIVAAIPGKKIRVISYSLIAAGNTSISFADGLTQLIPPMTFVAGSGIVEPRDPSGIFADGTSNNAFNIVLTGPAQVSGRLSYILV